ncbi:MAG: BatA and WFA domain-containing protein [Thermodesulfobacteriota bacterium]
MGIFFISPLFLLGLGGTAIPILIHRLSRKRARLKKFPAVRLLLESQRQLARPRRIKHLLVLALRILIVAGLSFMLARPVLVSQGGLALVGGSQRTMALIFDNSASMRYRETLSDRVSKAKEAALTILGNMKERGKVIVIPTVSAPASDAPPRLLFPEEAMMEVKTLPVSFGTGDLNYAFSQAYQALQPLKGQKEIVMVTDLTRGEWENFNLARLKAFDRQVPVKFIRLGEEKRDDNAAILSAEFFGGPVVGAAMAVRIVLANYGQRPVKGLAVRLMLNGEKVDQKAIDLEPFDRVTTSLELRAMHPGWARLEITISQDRLVVDDSYYLSFKVEDKLRALVVDGDPKTSLKASETYYLVNALNPQRTGEDSPVVPRVITADELTHIDITPYRLIVLANLEKLNRLPAQQLLDRVEAGASLFIFLGDKVAVERYNSYLYDGPLPLLPQRLKAVYQSENKPERIGKIAFEHPALTIFKGAEKSLISAKFHRYFLLDMSEVASGSRVLIATERGDPLLIQTQVGEGKVFLFTSSADADWNDLSLKTGYLPLIQSLVQYGAGLQPRKTDSSTRVGEPLEFSPSKEAGSGTATGIANVFATVTDPSGKEATIMVSPEDGKTGARLGSTIFPGIYKIDLDGLHWLHAVNVPREESDLAKVSGEELAGKLGGLSMEVTGYRTPEDLSSLIRARRELWPILLLFIIALMVGETLLANRQ